MLLFPVIAEDIADHPFQPSPSHVYEARVQVKSNPDDLFSRRLRGLRGENVGSPHTTCAAGDFFDRMNAFSLCNVAYMVHVNSG